MRNQTSIEVHVNTSALERIIHQLLDAGARPCHINEHGVFTYPSTGTEEGVAFTRKELRKILDVARHQ